MAGWKGFSHEFRKRSEKYTNPSNSHLALYALDDNRLVLVDDDDTLSTIHLGGLNVGALDTDAKSLLDTDAKLVNLYGKTVVGDNTTGTSINFKLDSTSSNWGIQAESQVWGDDPNNELINYLSIGGLISIRKNNKVVIGLPGSNDDTPDSSHYVTKEDYDIHLLDPTYIASELFVDRDLYVDENAEISGSLQVYEDVTIEGDALINSDAFISGDITVEGDALFKSEVAISGNVVVDSSLTVNEASQFEDNLTVDGFLLVQGNIYANADSSVNGTATFRGQTIFEGDTQGISSNDIINTSDVEGEFTDDALNWLKLNNSSGGVTLGTSTIANGHVDSSTNGYIDSSTLSTDGVWESLTDSVSANWSSVMSQLVNVGSGANKSIFEINASTASAGSAPDNENHGNLYFEIDWDEETVIGYGNMNMGDGPTLRKVFKASTDRTTMESNSNQYIFDVVSGTLPMSPVTLEINWSARSITKFPILQVDTYPMTIGYSHKSVIPTTSTNVGVVDIFTTIGSIEYSGYLGHITPSTSAAGSPYDSVWDSLSGTEQTDWSTAFSGFTNLKSKGNITELTLSQKHTAGGGSEENSTDSSITIDWSRESVYGTMLHSRGGNDNDVGGYYLKSNRTNMEANSNQVEFSQTVGTVSFIGGLILEIDWNTGSITKIPTILMSSTDESIVEITAVTTGTITTQSNGVLADVELTVNSTNIDAVFDPSGYSRIEVEIDARHINNLSSIQISFSNDNGLTFDNIYDYETKKQSGSTIADQQGVSFIRLTEDMQDTGDESNGYCGVITIHNPNLNTANSITKFHSHGVSRIESNEVSHHSSNGFGYTGEAINAIRVNAQWDTSTSLLYAGSRVIVRGI